MVGMVAAQQLGVTLPELAPVGIGPEPGEYRAPAAYGRRPDFDGPGDWRWLCLDHVRAFNLGYNYFTGMSPDGALPEIVERPDHPWFIGVQFHPELTSRPFNPHPLFAGFIEAAVNKSRLV